MLKTRVQLYTDAETKRRIELAAAKNHMPVTQYCFEAVRQRLAEDDMLENERVEIAITPPKNETTLFVDMRALHQAIAARRKGVPIDIEKVMDEMHQEQEYELISMR